jgi:beta-lactam-binding protein with PASTA domain/tRNA A-37 threonylcarbamoyl transferase component Bud32
VSDVFQPEQVIGGRYRVVRKLGGGGMADVYLCEDLTLGRHVAVKVLLQRYLDDANFVERFRREAKAAAGLNQQNLVAIYDWGELDGTYYIVMEYVEGETLKDLIRRRTRLSGNEAVAVTLQLLAAVDSAHRSGIVHRDIKPQNVMLDRDGNIKVMDFGIARAGDSGMTEAGSILGTAQYLAPEQAKGYPVDERSDLYSVGVCLYEMLTGTVPFKGDSAVTVALKHVNEVPREPSELVPGMPYALNQIVLKAMAKDPADRYQSAAEFARDLRAAKEGGPVQAAAFDAGGERTRVMGAVAAGTTSVLDQPMTPRRKKSRWPLVLIILLLAIVAAVAVALWWTMSGNKVEVPSVVGLSRAAAVRALEDEGFKAGLQEEFSDRVAQGFVSRQAPKGGTRLREGATVDVWVSKGSQKADALPDFRGWTAAAVDDWLSENDLQGEPRTGRSNAVSEGQVFRQDPAPGTELDRGDTVTYWVSRGKPQADVPDLVNLTQADAEAALADAGLEVGTVTTETSTTVPAGSVISQDPPAGEQVDKGSAVSFVVSSGSPSPTPTPTPSPTSSSVEVPNVYGMQSAVAEQQLTALGLSAAFRQKPNTGQQPGTVVNVRPDAGTFVPPGSTVLLVIAS